MATSLAGRFFTERELNAELGIDSADTLWQRLAHEILFIASMSTTDKYPMYFRGQRNADWGMASSLFRLCRDARHSGAVTEDVMLAAEAATLTEAKAVNLGRWMTDPQVLMVLQHHGYATRLIDVSDGILEALYFAVDKDDAVDGRLFILRPSLIAGSVTDPVREDVLPVSPIAQLPWPDHAGAAAGSVPIWDERIAITERPPLDVRMFAQRGRLLVGGMPQPAPGRTMQVGTSIIPSDEWPEITTLAFDFPMPGETPREAWSGGAWTIRIEGSWKSKIRDRLAEWTYPITGSSMFPSIDTEIGRVDAAATAAAKGVP